MKIHLRTLGCRLNQGEIEAMARAFARGGHTLVDDPALADRVIVNTCAVTEDAARTSRQLVRQLHRANAAAAITVTGCYAQIAPETVAALPGVDGVIDNLHKDDLVKLIAGESIPVIGEGDAGLSDKGLKPLVAVPHDAPFDAEPMARGVPPWIGRTRAFVKVQDGCDNACTFCVTTIARGTGRSRSIDDVLNEIRLLLAMGYQEMVLTGVHLGSYGHDQGEAHGLRDLVRAILSDTDTPRLRLSSLEPWDISPDFFDLWRDPRLCPHLHLPLQSGCDATLRRMARKTSQAAFTALLRAARERIDDPCITSDVIVGFPGETDAEFEASAAFIEAMDFAGLHVFRYSRRPGTAAARMRGHVPEDVKKARSARLLALADALEARYAERSIGQVRPVLWEQIGGAAEGGFLNVGYTDNYLRVMCLHPRVLTNHLLPARLLAYDPSKRQMNALPLLETTAGTAFFADIGGGSR